MEKPFKKPSEDLLKFLGSDSPPRNIRELIAHCRGNLRKIASYWDGDSKKTVRGVIQDLGLSEALEQARGKGKAPARNRLGMP